MGLTHGVNMVKNGDLMGCLMVIYSCLLLVHDGQRWFLMVHDGS